MQKRSWVFFCLAFMTVGFLAEQAVVTWLPGAIALRAVCKGLASGSAALLCAIGSGITALTRDRLLTVGLIMCAIGDVLINLNGMWGMLFFGGAHILFCASFLCAGRPTRKQWLVFGIAGVLGAITLLLFREKVGSRLVPAMLYMLVLFFIVPPALHPTAPRISAPRRA